MKVELVKKLSPLERYLYFVRERHNVYLRRKAGAPWPWTDDEVLRDYFFTNIYRELDKTTQWFKAKVRDPLHDNPQVVLATITFRWFNYIPTGELLKEHGLLVNWDVRLAREVLGAVRDGGGQVFTGAFMINSPAGERKLEAIVRRVTKVWDDRHDLLRRADSWGTLEAAHRDLLRYEGLGGFMAYEVVCDLRYTRVLEGASDKCTWCNPGPGAVRGLYRILGMDFEKGNNATSPPVPRDWLLRTQDLLAIVRRRLRMPPIEMREIEMSLCEYDKAERLWFGDGRAKRKYRPHD